MKNTLFAFRNALIGFLYRHILKPIFFAFDPENVHDFMIRSGKILGSNPLTRFFTGAFFSYQNKTLHQKIHGIDFENPIGLAAGFDKNAELTQILPAVGFGFMEVGSITGEPCAGNAKPRLWRLKDSKSLVINYGLKNDGAVKIAAALLHQKFRIPVFTSIAKTNCAATVDTAAGIADYVKAFTSFTKIGQAFTINISCTNAFGGQPFTDPQSLEKLLHTLDQIETTKPIFLKFSPDLSAHQVDQLLEVATKHRIHGFICSNLTKNRTNAKIIDQAVPPTGGISGKVVEELANNLIALVYRKTHGKYTIIGCGGIFSAADAYQKIKLGASLLQLITGMIYEGPQIISEINRELAALLKKDGYKNISEAVGTEFYTQDKNFDRHDFTKNPLNKGAYDFTTSLDT